MRRHFSAAMFPLKRVTQELTSFLWLASLHSQEMEEEDAVEVPSLMERREETRVGFPAFSFKPCTRFLPLDLGGLCFRLAAALMDLSARLFKRSPAAPFVFRPM